MNESCFTPDLYIWRNTIQFKSQLSTTALPMSINQEKHLRISERWATDQAVSLIEPMNNIAKELCKKYGLYYVDINSYVNNHLAGNNSWVHSEPGPWLNNLMENYLHLIRSHEKKS